MPTLSRLVPLTLVSLVVACASAAERLEEGAALQAQGRWEEAADRYMDALEKEDTLSEARRRLQVVADTAVAVAIREASTRRSAGDSRGAAEAYLGIDALVERTRAVGVVPARPPDFERMRRSTLDAAIDESMAAGREARRGGRWGEARDGRGRRLTYWVEEGRYRYEARLQVLLVDTDGREVAESTVEVTHRGDFERGVYEGDASTLRLGRNEARLFDADVLRRRIQDIQRVVLSLGASTRIGDRPVAQKTGGGRVGNTTVGRVASKWMTTSKALGRARFDQ